jgi:hypothetical protein
MCNINIVSPIIKLNIKLVTLVGTNGLWNHYIIFESLMKIC